MGFFYRKKMLLAGLCAALAAGCLAGCSTGKKSEQTEQISADSVVMIVGDQEVRYSEVQTYCYFLKCQYGEGFGEGFWEYPVEGSETIGDQAKQEIVDTIARLKIISEVAEKQQVMLTADEQDETLQQAESLVQKADDQDKERYNLTVSQVNAIYQENAIAAKMFYISTNDADTHVSDAKAKQHILEDMEQQGKAHGTEDAEKEISKEQIDQAKEEIIKERQDAMFVEKYNQWLEDMDVDINQNFWNEFSLS